MKNNYYQGIYNPINKEKYKGTLPIIYRSGLELKYLKWCDKNSNVISFGSESVILPYISPKDGKVHRYYVDLVLQLKTNDGIKKYLVEVKPSSQIIPPIVNNRKKRSTILYESIAWRTNNMKWESARKWCTKNGYNFVLLTEKDIKDD